MRFVPPDEFRSLEAIAYSKGFLDGCRFAFDPVVASCRRGLCTAESRAGCSLRRSMPQFSTKRRVRHAATDMFDLVADVEKYPQFVPLCSGLTVKSRAEKDGKTVLVADMTVAYKIIRETFTSRVTLDRQGLKILVEYLNGPFKRMQNRWTFYPVEAKSQRRRVLYRLRIQKPNTCCADGGDVRRGVPAFCRRLRATSG
jgi:ribosome-associated toxin RatA of RatAB toxin-antitoxin module